MHDHASGTGKLSDQSAVRALNLDDVRLTYLVDGAMGLYPGEYFPDLPAGHWAAHPEALDQRGRGAISARGLPDERDGRALLFDAGLGAITGDSTYGLPNNGSPQD